MTADKKNSIGDALRTGVKWLGLSKFATQIYTWTLTILTMRALSPETYGLFAIAGVFIALLELFAELGLRTRLIQMESYATDYIRSVYGISIVASLLLSFLLAATSQPIAAFFQQPELTWVLVVLSAQFAFSSIAVIPDAMLKRELRFRRLALVEALQAIAAATVTIALAYAEWNVWSLVIGTIAGTAVRTIGLLVASPLKITPSFNFKGLGDTIKFGSAVTGQKLIWWFYSNLDRVLIGRLLDMHALGVYSAGVQLSTMPLAKVGGMLNLLAFTGLARTNKDKRAFEQLLVKAVAIVSIIFFPLGFGTTVIAYELTPVLFGTKWRGAEAIVAILALAIPIRALSLPLFESLNAIGEPGYALRTVSVSAVLAIAGIGIGSMFGILGVAVGVTIASLVSFLYTIALVSRRTEISAREIFVPIIPIFVISASMAIFVSALRTVIPFDYPSVMGVGSSILLGGIFYVSFLYMFSKKNFELAYSFVPQPLRIAIWRR